VGSGLLTEDNRATAYASLIGLSVGDAFGAQILLPADHPSITQRRLPSPPWSWTDDTQMACSVYQVLTEQQGQIDQDRLAELFAANFDQDRGYGSGAARMLTRIANREPWQTVTRDSFGGSGSWGNGGAMRAAPIGAWHRHDLQATMTQAARSAEITHSHPEGIAGAQAAALATAFATAPLTGAEILHHTATMLTGTKIADGITTALSLLHATPPDAATALGTGSAQAAHDTVPLALWIAATNLDNFENALWTVAHVATDVDTVAAIVGGILAARLGINAIPEPWRHATEPLPHL
jgi:ADP-ribosylglycohydrolase